MLRMKNQEKAKKQTTKKVVKKGLRKVIEGKTKIFYEVEPDVLEMVQKDDVTIGDGAKKFTIPNKGSWVNEISYNIFAYLQKKKVPTHLIALKSRNSMLVRKAELYKLEVIIRGEVALEGSFAKRHPRTAGCVFLRPLVELNYKGELRGIEDPLVYFDVNKECFVAYKPKERPSEQTCLGGVWSVYLPYSEREIAAVKKLARQVYTLVNKRFEERGRELGKEIKVIDMKIEVGYVIINGKYVLAVCDTICPDSMRIREGGKELSKQLIRNEGEVTPEAIDGYQRVMEITSGL